MEVSIITRLPVDKDFSGTPCHLKRTITHKETWQGGRKYNTKIEYCTYVVDERIGSKTLVPNPPGLTKLEVLGLKDKEKTTKFSREQINGLYNIIKDDVDQSLDKMDKEDKEDLLGLLYETQQDEPYGVSSDQWIPYLGE